MNILAEWLRRLSYLVHRGQHDDVLRREMESHRAMMGDATRFGNTLRLREESRDVWGWAWLDDIARDVRFAARTFVRSPGFSFIAVTSLALATGATTAIFSIVYSVLLRPLPFVAPDRLVQVSEIHQVGGAGSVAFADLQAFRAESVSFERFAGYELTTRLLETDQGSERVTAVIADGEFFPMLGVKPLAGRTFAAGDPPSVVVLSAGLWDRQFKRDPSVIGRTVTLTGNRWDPVQRRSVIVRRELAVLGVMPEAFQFPYAASSVFPGALPEARTDLWIPDDRPNGGRLGNVTGRLRPGVTLGAAAAELDAIEKRLDVTAPGPYRALGVQLVPLADDVLGGVYRSLWLLFAAVGLVLAAACANVANLLLSRTTARAHEVVTRAALGASPRRLISQFLVESLLLGLTGGAVGILVAHWTLNLLVTVGAARIPRAHEIALDWSAFAFLLTICMVVALLFGLGPALLASRTDAHDITRTSGGRSTTSSTFSRIRDGLVIVEVALAFVLALGVAGVMSELSRLERTDTGMVTDRVITIHMTPRLPDADYFAIENRVAQLPGVSAAGFIQMVPLQNWGWIGDFHITGRPREDRPTIELRSVTPGYFSALGVPIRKGRNVSTGDGLREPGVILVNETLARLHFGGEDPVGRDTDRGTIVGVVGDVRQAGLNRPVAPEIYGVVNRNAGIASDLGMSLIVRTAGPPEAIVPAVRAAARDVNPLVALFNIKTMSEVIANSLWELNLYRWLIGLFAGLALVLAAIGLYGVISYSVSSRTREFAVRLALGSDPAGVARLVLGRGLRLTATGLVCGIAVALGSVPLLRRLSGVFMPEPQAFAAIVALLLAIALAACLVPALRVARVNPATALRQD
jgi:putative ABC transport system permease protein